MASVEGGGSKTLSQQDIEAMLKQAQSDLKDDQSSLSDAQNSKAQLQKQLDGMSGWDKFWSSKDEKLQGQIDGKTSQINQLTGEIAADQDKIGGLQKMLDEMKNYANITAELSKQGVDVNGMDLQSMMMALFMKRGDTIEDAIRAQAEGLNKKNQEMAVANKMSEMVRAGTPTGSNKAALPGEVVQWAKDNGIELPGSDQDPPYSKLNKDQFDSVLQSIKGQVDTLSNNSQMDMVKLQNLMDKRNQSFDFISNFISKMAKTDDTVIQNTR